MPFMTLDGFTVPVAVGTCSQTTEEVGGGLERAQDAGLVVPRLSLKRSWSGRTPPRVVTDWLAIHGLVEGLGEVFAYDSHLFGSKGSGPQSGSVTTLRTVAEIVGTVTNPKYGAGCLAVEAATTNLLPQNVRTGTDSGGNTAGFTLVSGATISSDTAQAWQGTKALKVVTAASVGSGVETDTTGVFPEAALVSASVYVYATSAISVRVRLFDAIGATYGTAEIRTLTANTWQRFQVQHTLTGGPPGAAKIVVDTDTAAVKTFWCDGFQLEDLDWHTSWIGATAGATQARSAGQLSYRPRFLQEGLHDLTIMCWLNHLRFPGILAGTQRVFYLQPQGGADPTTGSYLSLWFNRDDGSLNLQGRSAGVLGINFAVNSVLDNFAWHHVAVVVRRTTSDLTVLYADGVSGGSSTSAPPWTAIGSNVELSVGHRAAVETFDDGLIDDLVVLPYAATAAQVAAFYALGTAFPLLPKLTLGGDVQGGLTTTVIGRAAEVLSEPHQASGSWQNNAAAVAFELVEV